MARPGFAAWGQFVGDSGWVHVDRGTIIAYDDKFLRDPQNEYDTMPVKLTASNRHICNFVDAVKSGGRTSATSKRRSAATRCASFRRLP